MTDRFHEEDHGIRRVDQGWALVRDKPVIPGVSILIDLPPQEDYHILPIGDCGRHWMLIGCRCSPRVIRILDQGLVYLHQAHDEREISPDPLINALTDLLP